MDKKAIDLILKISCELTQAQDELTQARKELADALVVISALRETLAEIQSHSAAATASDEQK